ncbi:uncharacterized protein [Dermacentor albipictus]
MTAPSARTLMAFVACNTTEQCEALGENATCAKHVCLCPSFDPLAEGTRCNSTRPFLPMALGKNCTSSTDCSSTAACVAGRCRCPDGYQPSGELECSAIRQTEYVTSWFAFMTLASSILLILMLVLYLCVVGCRGRHSQWPIWRPTHAAASATTLVVPGQASFCGDDPTTSPFFVSALTAELVGGAVDTFRLSTGVTGTPLTAQHQEGRESWQASMMEISTQAGAASMSELRGLGGSSIEPFVRPVLSNEKVHARYPHLARIFMPASQRSGQVSGPSEPPVSENASDEKTKKDESFMSSTNERSSKLRRARRASGSVEHVVVSPKKDDRKGPQAADAAPCEDGCPRDDSGTSRQQPCDFSLSWSSVGSSLDALRSVPVLARVRDSSSSGTETSLKAEKERHLPVDKFQP